MVIVMVTSYKVIEKNIKIFRKMMLYNIYKTHIDLKENIWSFRVD